MSHIDVMQDRHVDRPRVTVDALMIVCCLPVLVVSAIVLALSDGFKPGFFFPAVVVGAMIGMLMYEGGLELVPPEARSGLGELAPQMFAFHSMRVHGTATPQRSAEVTVAGGMK